MRKQLEKCQLQTSVKDFLFKCLYKCIFTFLARKADEVKRTESQFVWQLPPFQYKQKSPKNIKNTSILSEQGITPPPSWYDGLGPPGGLLAAASYTWGPCYTTEIRKRYNLVIMGLWYFFKLWELMMSSQCFQVVQSIDIVESISVKCF